MLPFRAGGNGEGPPTVKQRMRKHQCKEPAGTDAAIDAVPLQPPRPHLSIFPALCLSASRSHLSLTLTLQKKNPALSSCIKL